jgi:hypothetical protein
VALSHAEQLGLPSIPDDVPLLWESGIAGTMLGVVNLGADAGAARAIASRISVPSMRTNLLLEGVLVDDYWLVTMPGQGSLFVETEGNYWPLLKDTIIPVGFLKRPWAGTAEYRPTRGPGPGRSGELVGATGRFAGRTGGASESLVLERYSAEGGFESLRGELSIALDPLPVDEAAAAE